jgi:hypothetical protein
VGVDEAGADEAPGRVDAPPGGLGGQSAWRGDGGDPVAGDGDVGLGGGGA